MTNHKRHYCKTKTIALCSWSPYLDKFSIIGTTDLEYKGDPRNVAIDDVEVDYLNDIVNQHFVTNSLAVKMLVLDATVA